MNIADILSLPAQQQLTEVEAKRSAIKEKLDGDDFATPEVRQAYEDAIAHLGESALGLAGSDELQTAYAASGIEAIAGLEQLEPLHDILPEARLASLKGELQARIDTARDFYAAYGAHSPEAENFIKALSPEKLALAATTELKPVDETDKRDEANHADVDLGTAEPEAAGLTKAILLTVGQKVVRIGDGRSVRYDQIMVGRQDFTDYSLPRRAALIKLLSLPRDVSISSDELYQAAFGDVEYDEKCEIALRLWFCALTDDDKERLVLRDGDSYLFNPVFAVNHILGSRLQSELDEALQPEVSAAPEPELASPRIPSLLSDLWVTGDKLRQFNFVLEALHLPQITDEIWSDFNKHQPDLSEFATGGATIQAYRMTAISRIEALLEDEKAFFEYYDSLEKDSTEYNLIEFFALLNENEREQVKRLLTATIKTTKLVRGQVVTIPIEVWDNEGYQIYPLPETGRYANPSNGRVASNGHAELINNSDVDKIHPSSASDGAVVTAAEPQPTEAGETALDDSDSDEAGLARNNENRVKQARLAQITEFANDIATKLVNELDPMKMYRRGTYYAILGNTMATKNFANARENSIGGRRRRGPKTFSLADALLVAIYSNEKHQESTKLYPKDVNAIINAALEAAVDQKADQSL